MATHARGYQVCTRYCQNIEWFECTINLPEDGKMRADVESMREVPGEASHRSYHLRLRERSFLVRGYTFD